MSPREKTFSVVRRRIEQALETAEKERLRKLLSHRLVYAREGILAYQKGQITEAVRAYSAYIRILEETKGVGEGRLMPSCFDIKKDVAELMMISGVYWDLVKIYDHAQSSETYQEFLKYFEKYIIFSKGLPFQSLCAESLRKYINKRKPIHIEPFRNAYQSISVSKCFVASSLIDVTEQDTSLILRKFRDQVLKKNSNGRAFVCWYYRNGPRIAAKMNRLPFGMRKSFGLILDWVARIIRSLS